jgi:hypothetical protein
MMVSGYHHPKSQELARLIAESMGAVLRHVEDQRHRIAGFAHYPLDTQRREYVGRF